MGWYDMLEMLFASAAGTAFGWVMGVLSFLAWLGETLWKGVVRFFLVIIEWADERWYELDIAYSPWLRAAVAAGAGFFLAVALTLAAALLSGNGWLVLLFCAVIGGAAGVGLLADPDKDWSLPAFPRAGKAGPDVPINL
jgi:hypothetical protein